MSEIETLYEFNAKKGPDYPLFTLNEHNTSCKYNYELWEAFQISFKAFSEGEGFVDAKNPINLNGKYQNLVLDLTKAIIVLKKIVKAFERA